MVIASGACNRPTVPAFADAVPRERRAGDAVRVSQPRRSFRTAACSSWGRRRPACSSPPSCRQSGRPVTLSVGEHVRLPRTYRGRDVLWWMDASGVWDQRHDEVEDLTRARRLPSPQLVGTPERTTLDLNALTAMDVELVGRWASVRDGQALFSGGLRNVFSLADLKLQRLLDGFDEWARTSGVDLEVGPPERFAPTEAPRSPRWQLDLRSGEIQTDRLGDRLPAGLRVARRAGPRREGPPPPRRRRRRQPGPVRAGPAGAAAAQVHVHPRHRGRRARGDRPTSTGT